MRATAHVVGGLGRANLPVTAMRFSDTDVTTLARPSQSIKASARADGPSGTAPDRHQKRRAENKSAPFLAKNRKICILRAFD
jgi:hypothetical protein